MIVCGDSTINVDASLFVLFVFFLFVFQTQDSYYNEIIKFIPTVGTEVIFSVFRGKHALMKLSYYFLPGGNTVNCSNRKKGHYAVSYKLHGLLACFSSQSEKILIIKISSAF